MQLFLAVFVACKQKDHHQQLQEVPCLHNHTLALDCHPRREGIISAPSTEEQQAPSHLHYDWAISACAHESSAPISALYLGAFKTILFFFFFFFFFVV
jgi:hypothetical protein